MKNLIALVCLCAAVSIQAASPTYEKFIGSGGIVIQSNPPNGQIIIDGSGIGGGASGIPIQNGSGNNTVLTNPTARVTLNVLGTITVSTNLIVTNDVTFLEDLEVQDVGVNDALFVRSSNTLKATFQMESYSNAFPQILLQKARDIPAAPSAVQAGDTIFLMEGFGRGSANYRTCFRLRADTMSAFSGTSAETLIALGVGNNSSSLREIWHITAYNWTNQVASYFSSNVVFSLNANVLGTLTATTFSGAGGGVTLNAAGFDGNLATTDDTIQEVAQKVDDLSLAGNANPVFQIASAAGYSNFVFNLPGASSTVTIFGTNEWWKANVTSNITVSVNSLKSNIVYKTFITNNTSVITWPATFRWIDGQTLTSAPSLTSGTYILCTQLGDSGTNAWVETGPGYTLVPGFNLTFTTNAGAGTITQGVDLDSEFTGLIVTNNLGYAVGTVAGVGGALTNFTLLASADESIIYINAATNVNIVAIMGGSATVAYRGTVIMTNRTGTSRPFSLGAATNNFISLQQFDGLVAPYTITNNQAARFEYEILGTNVFYAYKPMALPTN